MYPELNYIQKSLGSKLEERHLAVIDYFFKNGNKPTYAKKVYENVDLSEPSVGKACKELVERGIFKIKKKKIKGKRRPGKDNHYYISRHPDVYRKLLLEYLSKPDIDKKLLFMESTYAQPMFTLDGLVGELIGEFIGEKMTKDTKLAERANAYSWDGVFLLFNEMQAEIYMGILKVSPTALHYVYFHENWEEYLDTKTCKYTKSFEDILTQIPIKEDIIIDSNQEKIIQSFHKYWFKLLMSCMVSDILRYPKLLLEDQQRKKTVNRILRKINKK